MFYYLFLCVMAVLGFGPILLKLFLNFMAYFGEVGFMGPVWIGLSKKWDEILSGSPITFSFLAVVGCTVFFGMLAYKIYTIVKENEKERNDFMELVPWLKILNLPKVKRTERFGLLFENEEDTRDCENQVTGILKVEPDDGLWTLPYYKYFRRYFYKSLNNR